MMLTALGVNHKTAPVSIRERIMFPSERMPSALAGLIQLDGVSEAMILSTCNRTELYTDHGCADQLTHWLAKQHHYPVSELRSCSYAHRGGEAVQHLMRVASGLDSMVLGENQILSQVKHAFQAADRAGAVGHLLQPLMQNVFSVTKQIRADTAIGKAPVSVAYTAVQLAKQVLAPLSPRKVLLIGAGEMIELTAVHLMSQGVSRMVVANRALSRAHRLAKQFAGHAITMEEIPLYLREVDIVMSATSAQEPVLDRTTLENVMRCRRYRPIFIVDMALPRDIDPAVKQCEGVHLYDLDALHTVVQTGLKSRKQAAAEAEAIIGMQAAHFMSQWRARDELNTLRSYRNRIEQLGRGELTKALKLWEAGQAPDAVMQHLVHALTKKIMHDPTVCLRQAAYDGHQDVLAVARRLFALDH